MAAAGGTLDITSLRQAVLAALGGGHLDDDTVAGLLDDAIHQHDAALAELPGRLVADLPVLASDLVLTHRLSDHERTAGRLELDPDLGAIARLASVDGGLHTAAGAPLHRRDVRTRGASRAGGMRWTTHLEGPAGWLAELPAGQLVAVRAADGVLALTSLDEHDLGPAPEGFASALGELIDAVNDGDGSPVWDEDLQFGAAVAHREWFDRPRAPFGELLTAAGYEFDGRDVGRPGCWEEHERLARAVASLARHQDLPDDAVPVLIDGLAAFDAWAGTNSRAATGAAGAPPGSTLRRRLHERWQAALALLDELRWRGATADRLAGFAEALGDGARGEQAAVGLWLASRAAAMAGRALDAERLVGEARDADGWFVPAVDEAAWYAADRGRAREAANLLHRVRVADDPELEALRGYAQLAAPSVGRNEPCPCGSGRKFKQCHLGRAELPERDRVRWLLDKARNFVMQVAPPKLVEDLTREHGVVEAEMVALDAVLFDDGWLTGFLESRGPLLGEWERQTAAAWPPSSVTSVFRVDRIDDAGRRQLTDAATTVTRVVEVSPALDVAGVDRLVWCRLVPVGDRWYTTGVGRLVSLGERSRLVGALRSATTPAETIGTVLGSGDGPVLQNTSGDPMMMCAAILRPVGGLDHADGADLAERLDKALEREDDVDPPVWRMLRDTSGMERAIIATVRVDDDGIHAETNSIARHDEILAVLRDALGELERVTDERVPFGRLRALERERDTVAAARRALGLADDDTDDDTDDDDVLDDGELDGEPAPPDALLDEFTRDQEQRWLDQPIPALGGHTPRDAAADDALRPDLLTLLAETEGRGLFDPDRLRAALGLV